MNGEGLGSGKLISYLAKRKSLVPILAALIIGVLMMLFGRNGDTFESVETSPVFDTSALEQKVAGLCSRVDGVGSVSVMITADTVSQKLYAQNSRINTDFSSTEYVTVSGGLLPTGEKAMTVRGVAVVCEGGDDPSVRYKLTELICALFDIGAGDVSIVGGK